MRTFRNDGSRTAFIVVVLLISLTATAVLAWEAYVAATVHRAAAANVLRDYAELAADELIRRSTATVGYDGFYPITIRLSEALGTNARIVDIVEELTAAPDDKLREALGLARAYFQETESGIEYFEVGIGRSEPAPWLMDQLARREDVAPPYAVLHRELPDGPHSVVLLPAAKGKRRAGFEVDLEALAALFERALERPLFPTSLGSGETTNDALSVSIFDHGNVERFRSPTEHHPEFSAERSFGDAYSGVLDGWSVQVSIDPAAAPDLIIGGLPSSRVPLLLGLFLVSVALVAVAMLQLRRERMLQRLRSEFVASVSHELRTPLAQIRMFAETLMLGRVRSEDEKQHSLRIVAREATRLTHLVENLLQFSRPDRDAATSSAVPVALAGRVRETVQQFEALAADRNVRMVTRLDPTIRAAIDPDALQQVVLNLLDNAVKYGPDAQEILVAVEGRGGIARVTIDDEGPGVPSGLRDAIFDGFFRLERERGSAVAGTGVGLSVVRDIIARHGGRAFVEPRADHGSRFVVELPRSGNDEAA